MTGESGGADRPHGVSAARIVRNTLINAVATVGGMAITILLTPFMLRHLGTTSFGIWALALTLTVATGYLSLTDLGLQQAAVRFLADARREADRAALISIFSTTLAIFAGIAAVVAVIVAALAPLFASLFSVHGEVRHAAILSFAIVGGQVLFDLPALAYRAVLESDQRFGAIRAIDLGRAACFAALTVIALLLGRGVVAVSAASAAAAAVGLIGYVLSVRAITPEAKFQASSLTRAQLRPLFRFSGSLFVLRVLSVAYRQMDKVILGVILTVSAVASYEVAVRVQAALFLVIGLGGSALLPAASLARLDRRVMRALFLRATAYSAALFLPVSIAVCLLARPVVLGWAGDRQGAAVSPTRLFAAWVALATFDVAGNAQLTPIRRPKPTRFLPNPRAI